MKIFLIITSLFIGVSILGQGNLQFNKAVHTEISCANVLGPVDGYLGATISVVVPVGKTLKITSAYILSQHNTYYPAPTGNLLSELMIDETPLALYFNGSGIYPTNDNMFPIWLPTGTYSLKIVYKLTSASPANTFSSKAYISGIEFNIIP